MINIKLDEKSVFTYDAENLEIQLWDHRDGKWHGPVIGMIGSIKFAAKWQVIHFMEMLEFILEQKNENKTEEVAS